MKSIKRILSLILLGAMMMSLLTLTSCDRAEPEIIRDEKYTTYKNYSYGKNKRQVFDLCLPTGASGELGLVFYIHGGAWGSGDKDVHAGDIKTWAERGYAAASLSYRYADGKITVDDILDDINSCLVAVLALAAVEGVELTGVLLAGGSAGGHLAQIYAYKMYETAPIAPVAVVSYAGPADLTDGNFYVAEGDLRNSLDKALSNISGAKIKSGEYEPHKEKLAYASPITYVSEHSAPTLICHGTLDDVVPVSNAYTLAKTLEEHGVLYDLIIFENSGHGLEADPECSERANALFIEYAEKYLARKK